MTVGYAHPLTTVPTPSMSPRWVSVTTVTHSSLTTVRMPSVWPRDCRYCHLQYSPLIPRHGAALSPAHHSPFSRHQCRVTINTAKQPQLARLPLSPLTIVHIVINCYECDGVSETREIREWVSERVRASVIGIQSAKSTIKTSICNRAWKFSVQCRLQASQEELWMRDLCHEGLQAVWIAP
jgi:hypothetical protein